MKLVFLALLMAGCGDQVRVGEDAAPDAQSVVILDAPTEADFFGEACAVTAGANTVCHPDDRGWCVSGVCRPMCGQDAMRCRFGVERYLDTGGCYCSPN